MPDVTRIGKHAFIGGMTRVAADVPPFVVMVRRTPWSESSL